MAVRLNRSRETPSTSCILAKPSHEILPMRVPIKAFPLGMVDCRTNWDAERNAGMVKFGVGDKFVSERARRGNAVLCRSNSFHTSKVAGGQFCRFIAQNHILSLILRMPATPLLCWSA